MATDVLDKAKSNEISYRIYGTRTSLSTSNRGQQRNSISSELVSLFRSIALKPFKIGSTSSIESGVQTETKLVRFDGQSKTNVSLLKYRPLSDVMTDHAFHCESKHAAHEFLRRLGWSLEGPCQAEINTKWNITMKYLFPTKFDAERALNLYKDHQRMRKNENLDNIWIQNPQLIDEIESSKFYTLRAIYNQPLVICFTAANVNTSASSNKTSTQDHELIALQALICQLDVATEEMEVQKTGINFIYDMQNCTATQFDMNLSNKIVKLLQGKYPAMVKNIFVVSPPKWFRIVYKVNMCTTDEIHQYLVSQYQYSSEDIPISFGGTMDPTVYGRDRYETCLSVVMNPHSICNPYYSVDGQRRTKTILTAEVETASSMSNSFLRYFDQNDTSNSTTGASLMAFGTHDNHSTETKHNHPRKRESSTSSDSEKRRRSSSILTDDDANDPFSFLKFATTNDSQHVQYQPFPSRQSRVNTISSQTSQVKSKPSNGTSNSHRSTSNQQNQNDYGTRLLMSDFENAAFGRSIKKHSDQRYRVFAVEEFLRRGHDEIRLEFRSLLNPPAQDTHAARDQKNLDKSRYRDVIPGEATRVLLLPDGNDDHDFINANYVSGYKNQEKAYIFTQGPLPSTVNDFWRMVWQENISVIVMTTNIREAGVVKCFQYWPNEVKRTFDAGPYHIQNETMESYNSFVISRLTLTKVTEPDEETRTIYHAHYRKWPDHGVPAGTKDALDFLDKINRYRALGDETAPILLHCSAGIGRTGTFCALDISIKRFLDTRTIDIPTIVLKMRTERAGSVQTEDQYLFAHLALMNFIRNYQMSMSMHRETRSIDVNNDSNSNTKQQTNDQEKKTMASLVSLNRSRPINDQSTAVGSSRGKTLSESSVPAIHYLTSTNQMQTSNSTANEVNNKKARK